MALTGIVITVAVAFALAAIVLTAIIDLVGIVLGVLTVHRLMVKCVNAWIVISFKTNTPVQGILRLKESGTETVQ